MTEAAAAERFEQAAQLRDAIRTIETLRDAAAEDGRRRARRSRRVRPQARAGRRRGADVPDARRARRRARRAGDRAGPDARRRPGRDAERRWRRVQRARGRAAAVLRRSTGAAGDAPAGGVRASGHRDARGLAVGVAGRRVRLVVPKRGEKRGLLDLAARNAALAYQAHFDESVAAHYDALETLRVVLALPALPRRIECFDISTLQGGETVASMVVCEEGRMKRTEYRKFRIRGVESTVGDRESVGSREPVSRKSSPAARLAASARAQPRASMNAEARAPSASAQPRPEPRRPAPIPGSSTTSRRCTRSCCGAIGELLEPGGPFPDLILIDGGKGQLSAAYAALAELGLERLVAVGIAKKEELLFTRDRVDGIALRAGQPGAAADAADPRRGAPLRGHVPSPAAQDRATCARSSTTIAGIGPRRRKPLLTTFGSVAGVRRASREELGARSSAPRRADAVLRTSARAPEGRRGLAGARQTLDKSGALPYACRFLTPAIRPRLSSPSLDLLSIALPFAIVLIVALGSRGGARVDGRPARRSDRADARPDVAQSAGAHRLDRHGPVSADRALTAACRSSAGRSRCRSTSAGCGAAAATSCWSPPPGRSATCCWRSSRAMRASAWCPRTARRRRVAADRLFRVRHHQRAAGGLQPDPGAAARRRQRARRPPAAERRARCSTGCGRYGFIVLYALMLTGVLERDHRAADGVLQDGCCSRETTRRLGHAPDRAAAPRPSGRRAAELGAAAGHATTASTSSPTGTRSRATTPTPSGIVDERARQRRRLDRRRHRSGAEHALRPVARAGARRALPAALR